MNLELTSLYPQQLLPQRQSVARILACNEVSARFGLALNPEEALALVEARQEALLETGRVEFRGGILEDIIFAFCDSPYIEQANYAETLEALAHLFYVFKSETMDKVPDAELIAAMKAAFDGPPCYGSLELLEGRVLAELGRRERFRGLTDDDEAQDEDDDEGEDEDA